MSSTEAPTVASSPADSAEDGTEDVLVLVPRLTPEDLRRPRWLAAHVGILVLMIAFALLGRWQWDVGHKVAPLTTAELQAWRTPEPVGSVITAASGLNGTQVGQAIAATGTYDSARQLLVPGRVLNGHTGYYVLTPLVTGSGEAVLVNRGFLSASGGTVPAIPAAPKGRISITGWAAEPESTTGEVNANGISETQASGKVTAADEIQYISPAELVNQWPYHLNDGYVTATDPASLAGGLQLVAAPLPPHGTTWDALNVCYAFQWWLFIGILGSWYVVHLRRELRGVPVGAVDDDGDEEDDDED
ncbi:SURF1 family protein [Actinospica sp.]|uniref:SURF1 family protein n=1 Tax=Actinospica sp. TaxID=1872142 RepID=UPI002D013733|nr:SURF1 family protein [Actinospica sp.]HWG28199.1 SURF1 family protein [Actinospica sp.]